MKVYAKVKRYRDNEDYRESEQRLITAFFRNFNPKSSIRINNETVELEIEFKDVPPMDIIEAIPIGDTNTLEYVGVEHALSDSINIENIEPEKGTVGSCDSIASGIHKVRKLKAECEAEKGAISTMAEKLKPLKGNKIATFGARPQIHPQYNACKKHNQSDSSEFIHIPELDDMASVSSNRDEFITNVTRWLKISDKGGKSLRFKDALKLMMTRDVQWKDLVNTQDRQHYVYKITAVMKSIGHAEITPLKFIGIVCKYAFDEDKEEANLQMDEQKIVQNGDQNSKQDNAQTDDQNPMHTDQQEQAEQHNVQDDDLNSKQDNAQTDDQNPIHTDQQEQAEQHNVQDDDLNSKQDNAKMDDQNPMHTDQQEQAEQHNVQDDDLNSKQDNAKMDDQNPMHTYQQEQAEQHNVHSNDHEAGQDNVQSSESHANNSKSIKCFEKIEDFTRSINAIDSSITIEDKIVRILELIGLECEEYNEFLSNMGYNAEGIKEVKNGIKDQSITAVTIEDDKDFSAFLDKEVPEDDIIIRLDFASLINIFVNKNGLEGLIKVKTFLTDLRNYFR